MALPTAPISGINQNLFPFKVNSEFFKEWVKITPLSNLMGSQMNRPIYRHQLRAGEGLQFRVGRLSALDYKSPVLNLDQRRGAAQQQQVDEDRVDTKFQSFTVQLVGKDIVELGTPIRLPQQVRPQLIEVCQRNLNFDLFNEMTTNNYTDLATQKPSHDRVLFGGYAPTRATYNALVGLTTAFNGMATGTAYNQNGLSAAMLLAAKAIAEQGGKTDATFLATPEAGIQPAYMETRAGWPMNDYILLMDPVNLPTLLADPLFLNTTMARGTVVESDQPQAIHGADYIGRFFGIHIYVVKDLMQYQTTSQDGNKTASWNILMGAGALTVGWYEYPFIVTDTDEIERIQLFTAHEQRGQKILKFPSKIDPTQTIEQGIMHLFTRIA